MTSHNRTDSTSSTLTELSDGQGRFSDNSFSSDASTSSVTSDDFKQQITVLMQNESLSIENLQSRAQALITTLSSNATHNAPLYGDPEFKETTKLHSILEALLHYAHDCGGDNGKRYTACAICACSEIGEDDMILPRLQSLATTWLSHLLFVFKGNRSHRMQMNLEPSPIATPTRENTATYLDKGTKQEREDLFRTNVILRDGYRCAVTGRYDVDHPQVPPESTRRRVKLRACHILRRAIAVFKSGPDSKEYLSALTTFDILRNYADLPIKNIEEIANVIDDTSNGFALESNAHDGFDNFTWSLKETKENNEYTTVIYNHEGAHGLTDDGQKVIFTDHSDDFGEPSSPVRKRLRSGPASIARGFHLPNPLFIRIHAAIAGVLHMSGAGESIEQALDRARRRGTGVVLIGDDFAYLGLAENVDVLMNQVAVH